MNTCPFLVIPIYVLGYTDTPSPQSHCAIVSKKYVTVRLFICFITSKVAPEAFVQITGIFLNWASILIPEVCANGGCHVDGGDEAKHTSDDECCSKTVIHSGTHTALYKNGRKGRLNQGHIKIHLKEIISKSPFISHPLAI